MHRQERCFYSKATAAPPVVEVVVVRVVELCSLIVGLVVWMFAACGIRLASSSVTGSGGALRSEGRRGTPADLLYAVSGRGAGSRNSSSM